MLIKERISKGIPNRPTPCSVCFNYNYGINYYSTRLQYCADDWRYWFYHSFIGGAETHICHCLALAHY